MKIVKKVVSEFESADLKSSRVEDIATYIKVFVLYRRTLQTNGTITRVLQQITELGNHTRNK